MLIVEVLEEGRFAAVVEADEALAITLLHQSQLAEHTSHAVAPLVVAACSGEVEQIFLQSTHRAIDRHLVVIQHDEHIIVALRHVVQTFERQSSTHSTIADDGHYATSRVTLLLSGHSHAKGGRDRVRRMSAGKGVILALLG